MLYNGGFTTGVAALILIPILEHYSVPKRREMKQYINLQDMMTVNETVPGKRRKNTDNNKNSLFGTNQSKNNFSFIDGKSTPHRLSNNNSFEYF